MCAFSSASSRKIPGDGRAVAQRPPLPTRCAFVSTNSITQGEQVSALWKNLNAEIDFAYRTFKWHNDAKGNAAVHCVIIGFHAKGNGALGDRALPSVGADHRAARPKTIYSTDGTAIPATHINGYLMDAPDIIVESRNTALCDVPQMIYGNKPTDGGNLIMTPDEKDAFLADEPQAEPFIRPLLGAEEFINGKKRYCLWLVDADLSLLRKWFSTPAPRIRTLRSPTSTIRSRCRPTW